MSNKGGIREEKGQKGRERRSERNMKTPTTLPVKDHTTVTGTKPALSLMVTLPLRTPTASETSGTESDKKAAKTKAKVLTPSRKPQLSASSTSNISDAPPQSARIARQQERRHEQAAKYRANETWFGQRDSTVGREYTNADNHVILRCHVDHAVRHGNRSRIPMAVLTGEFNRRVVSGKPREVSGLASHISKHAQLRGMRSWYDVVRS